MKRLAALSLIMLFVFSSTGCRRGLRLWGLRGTPCRAGAPGPMMQPGMMQPGMMQPGMMQPGMMQPNGPMATPSPAPVCCPPVDVCSPPVDCGCAVSSGYGAAVADGREVTVADTGYDIQPGEWLAPSSSTGTAAAPSASTPPASLPPSLPSR